ncbi:MAG: M20 peptidase family dipeptidase [Alphaproteobacteria bacterium]|nr:MAG: M20 peptidase family dipeptidase [Alphaproteobacteria bacterium]
MSRDAALAHISDYFDNGGFFTDLARRVAIPTESQEPAQRPQLYRYLHEEMTPSLEALGFTCTVYDNPEPRGGPFLIARRHEGDDLPTLMSYGHGDVVRGYGGQWRDDLDPWTLTKVGERWYGRGTADNKGQHTINIAALDAVLKTRGRFGFNVVLLIETSEEIGSPGLRAFCAEHKDCFKADVFIASDGPRLAPERPTVFMGSRGVFNFTLSVNLREGGHHSGNWGGLLANPGIILAHAIASLTTSTGEILVPEWRPPNLPESVRRAVARLEVGGGKEAPAIDPHWGEPGLTPAEKVFAWNTFEVLAFKTGNPEHPANAIPPRALAHCHIRFVVPSDPATFVPALRRHLDARGFSMVEITPDPDPMMATRLDPDHPWARWAIASIDATTGKEVAVLPNLGGSLPNDVFAELLGLPTIWVPHSYAGCSQHAPDEHVLEAPSREALQMMTGLFWDLGAGSTPARRT